MVNFVPNPINCPLVLDFIEDLPQHTNIIVLLLEGFNSPFVIGSTKYMTEIKDGSKIELEQVQVGMTVKGPDNRFLKVRAITRWLIDIVDDCKVLLNEN